MSKSGDSCFRIQLYNPGQNEYPTQCRNGSAPCCFWSGIYGAGQRIHQFWNRNDTRLWGAASTQVTFASKTELCSVISVASEDRFIFEEHCDIGVLEATIGLLPRQTNMSPGFFQVSRLRRVLVVSHGIGRGHSVAVLLTSSSHLDSHVRTDLCGHPEFHEGTQSMTPKAHGMRHVIIFPHLSPLGPCPDGGGLIMQTWPTVWPVCRFLCCCLHTNPDASGQSVGSRSESRPLQLKQQVYSKIA